MNPYHWAAATITTFLRTNHHTEEVLIMIYFIQLATREINPHSGELTEQYKNNIQ